MFFEEIARRAGYPKGWQGFPGSTTTRTLFVNAQRAALNALNTHVPKPTWLTSDLLTLNPSAQEADRIDAAVQEIKRQLNSGLEALIVNDEDYRGILWMALIQANLGVVPMLEVLGDSSDPLFDMARDHDAPARLGVLQAVADMAVKYGQRQSESTLDKLFCVVNPVGCWALRKAKSYLGMGYAPGPLELPPLPAHRQALGVEPMTILILAGAAALAIIGIALVASIAYTITKSSEIKSFNDMYKARCLRPDRTQADVEWCNKLKAPESAASPAEVIGKAAVAVGIAFVIGLFGYRYATRGGVRA